MVLFFRPIDKSIEVTRIIAGDHEIGSLRGTQHVFARLLMIAPRRHAN